MNDLVIKVSKDNRCVLPSKTIIGNDTENLQYNMVFEFIDTFVDGIARLEYQIDEDKNYIWINKKDNTYYVPIKNILTKEGNVQFQLVITEEETTEGIPVYKSDIFTLYCKASLNSVTEAPESYELWIDQANQVIMTMDEKIQEVENLNIEVNKLNGVAYITLTDKEGHTKVVTVSDGNGIRSITKTSTSGLVDTYTITYTDNTTTTFTVTNGNGIASITKTGTEGLVDTYTITYTNGTTSTYTVTNGKDGVVPTQDLEQALMVYNALPKVSDTDTYIILDNTAKTPLKVDLKGNTEQEGTPTPSEPIDINVVTGDNNINIIGKNLFDISKVLTNTNVINNGDGTLTINTTSGSTGVLALPPRQLKDYCPNLQVGDIVFLEAVTTGTDKFIYLSTSGNSWNFGNVRTITQNDLDSMVYWYASGLNSTATISNIMIRKYATTTTYEPYQSQSYEVNLGTTELCKIGDYQDYIYKSGDNWYIHKEINKVVLNGNENEHYYLQGTYTNTCRFDGDNIIPNALPINSNKAICNYFTMIYGDTSDSEHARTLNTNYPTNVVFYINITRASTVTEFKNWLSTHNTILYYVLATATDTQITDTTLIEQLEALRYAYSYDTQTNISQTNDDLPFIITAIGIRSLVDIFNGGA